MPPSTTACSNRRRLSSDPCGEVSSMGVHTAPRANTGAPLTFNWMPSRSRSPATRSSRNPTRPSSNRTAADDQSGVVQMRRAVRVRPPRPHVGDRHLAVENQRVVFPSHSDLGPIDDGIVGELDRRLTPAVRCRRATAARRRRPTLPGRRRSSDGAGAGRVQRPDGARAGPGATDRRPEAPAQSREPGRAASCERSGGCRLTRAWCANGRVGDDGPAAAGPAPGSRSRAR